MKYYSLLALGMSLLIGHSIHASLQPIDTTRIFPQYNDLDTNLHIDPTFNHTTLKFNYIHNSNSINLNLSVGHTAEKANEGPTISDILKKYGNIFWFFSSTLEYPEISRCAFFYDPYRPLPTITVANIQAITYDPETYNPQKILVQRYDNTASQTILNAVSRIKQPNESFEIGLKKFLETFQTQTSKDLLSEIVQSQSKKHLQQGQQKLTELFGNLPKLTQSQSQAESIASHLYDTSNALITQKVSSENIHENTSTHEISPTEILPQVKPETLFDGQKSEFIFGDFSNQTTEEKPQKEAHKQTIPTKKEKKQKEKERLAAIKAQEEERKEKQRLQDQLQQLRKNIANQAAKKGKELLEKKELEKREQALQEREQAKKSKAQTHSNPNISPDKLTSKKQKKRNYIQELNDIQAQLQKYEDDENPHKTIDSKWADTVKASFAEYKGMAPYILADVITRLECHGANNFITEKQKKAILPYMEANCKVDDQKLAQELNNLIRPHVTHKTRAFLEENYNTPQTQTSSDQSSAFSDLSNTLLTAAILKSLQASKVKTISDLQFKLADKEDTEVSELANLLLLQNASNTEKKVKKFIKHIKQNPLGYIKSDLVAALIEKLWDRGHKDWPQNVLDECKKYRYYNFMFEEDENPEVEDDMMTLENLRLSNISEITSSLPMITNLLPKPSLSSQEKTELENALLKLSDITNTDIMSFSLSSTPHESLQNLSLLLKKMRLLGFYPRNTMDLTIQVSQKESNEEDQFNTDLFNTSFKALQKTDLSTEDVTAVLTLLQQAQESHHNRDLFNNKFLVACNTSSTLTVKSIEDIIKTKDILYAIAKSFDLENKDHKRLIAIMYSLNPEFFNITHIDKLEKIDKEASEYFKNPLEQSIFRYAIKNIIFNILIRSYAATENSSDNSEEEKQAKFDNIGSFEKNNSLFLYNPLQILTIDQFITFLILPHQTSFYTAKKYTQNFEVLKNSISTTYTFQSFIKQLPQTNNVLQRYIKTILEKEPHLTSTNTEIQKLEKLSQLLHATYCIGLYKSLFESNAYEKELNTIKTILKDVEIVLGKIPPTMLDSFKKQLDKISNITLALIDCNKKAPNINSLIEDIISISQAIRHELLNLKRSN